MRAAVVTAPGAVPACTEFAEPQVAPDRGEQLMTLVAAGVHPIVRSLAGGQHYASDVQFPQVAGVDAVARTTDGRLLYTGWVRPPWGTLAERLAAPVGLELPSAADPLAIAAGLNPGRSSWLPLRGRVAELGERGAQLGTVAVLGATGMAGGMAVQLALALGAQRVVAVGRDAGRLERVAALGARTVVLDPGSGRGAEALAELLAEDPPSLVLDFVWGPVAEAAFGALQRRGRGEDDADIVYTQIGAMAGLSAAVPATLLRSRRIRLVGSGAGSVSTERLLAELPVLMDLIADGTVAVPYADYPLERVADAWAHTAQSRAVVVP